MSGSVCWCWDGYRAPTVLVDHYAAAQRHLMNLNEEAERTPGPTDAVLPKATGRHRRPHS
ncbi:hypothetical protein [Streptomyces sp. NPDC097619]|uniref:hypothetical protein n=1 Tax=Streptomyces sp. NPDC097619 TaxID=3157228 RepID=UPI0033214F5E